MSAFHLLRQKHFWARYGILLIVLLGFALRMAMVVQGRGLEIRYDEGAYVDRAHDIVTNIATFTDIQRAPVYPFFLALIYKVLGEARFVIGVIQALISTFMLACLYTLTRLLFGRRGIALLAALFAAVYLEFLTLTRVLMSETLFIVLSVFGFTILFYARKKGHVWQLIPAGIVIALAALTRELLSYFVVLVLPVWMGMVTWKQPRQLALHVGALGLGLGLIFAPWIVRNYRLEQRFILSTSHSEIDLLRDNQRIELRAQNLPTSSKGVSLKKMVRAELKGVTGNARSLFVLTRAFQTIIHYPISWIQDKFTRLHNLWRPFALDARVVRLENISQPWRNLLQEIVSYSAVVLLLLGTLGILVAPDDEPKLLIGLYILYSLSIFLMTHYLPRFRLPLLALLLPYAAFVLVRASEWLRAPTRTIFTRHLWRTGSVVLLLGLFLILVIG